MHAYIQYIIIYTIFYDGRLRVKVEVSPAVSKRSVEDKFFADQIRERIAHSILQELLRLNSEFGGYVPREKQLPEVQLFPFGDSTYFPQEVRIVMHIHT